MEVLFVDLQMFVQVVDPISENRNLDFGRSGVAFVSFVLIDDALLYVFVIIFSPFLIRLQPRGASEYRRTQPKVFNDNV